MESWGLGAGRRWRREEAEAGGVGKDSVGFSEERKGETAWRTRDGCSVPGEGKTEGQRRWAATESVYSDVPFSSLGLASLRVPQTFQISACGANCDVLAR
jgi:hypothetical protein